MVYSECRLVTVLTVRVISSAHPRCPRIRPLNKFVVDLYYVANYPALLRNAVCL